MSNSNYSRGVIEGFYGQPWSFSQRRLIIQWMKRSNLNSYIYAPKFDKYHRVNWEKPYPKQIETQFSRLIQESKQSGIIFTFALSPGLSYVFDDDNHRIALISKYKRMQELGVESFALLMDDIPVLTADANQHAELLETIQDALPDASGWYFCPTFYSDLHIQQNIQGSAYLEIIGNRVGTEVKIFWTGPTIISKSINSDSLGSISRILHRKPCIWDNYHAIDYLPATSLFTGPLMHRTIQPSKDCSGYFMNFSQWAMLSLIPLTSSAPFLTDIPLYDPENYWLSTIRSFFPDYTETMLIILGYFFSPTDVSSFWKELLEKTRNCIRHHESTEYLIQTFRIILEQIQDDALAIRYLEWWNELFPFVQTLRGDIEFAIKLLSHPINANLRMYPELLRDPRWSTPIYHTVLSAFIENHHEPS